MQNNIITNEQHFIEHNQHDAHLNQNFLNMINRNLKRNPFSHCTKDFNIISLIGIAC